MKGTILHCWWECKSAQSLQKSLWVCLFTEKTHTTLSARLLDAIRKCKAPNSKGSRTPVFTGGITNNSILRTTQGAHQPDKQSSKKGGYVGMVSLRYIPHECMNGAVCVCSCSVCILSMWLHVHPCGCSCTYACTCDVYVYVCASMYS